MITITDINTVGPMVTDIHSELTKYGWQSEYREDLGFNIYSHWQFPGFQFTAEKAKKKMDEAVKKQMDSAIAFKTDENGINDLKHFLQGQGILPHDPVPEEYSDNPEQYRLLKALGFKN